MNIRRLRFRIHLSRAVGIAMTLESLLLVPRVAWADFGNFKTEKVKQCSGAEKTCKYFLKITDPSTHASCITEHRLDPQFDKKLVPPIYRPYPTCLPAQLSAYTKALKAGRVTPIDAPIPLKQVTVTAPKKNSGSGEKSDSKSHASKSSAGKKKSPEKATTTAAAGKKPGNTTSPASSSGSEEAPAKVAAEKDVTYKYNEKTGLYDKYKGSSRIGAAELRYTANGEEIFADVNEEDRAGASEIIVGSQVISVDKYGNRTIKNNPNAKSGKDEGKVSDKLSKARDKNADPCFESSLLADSQNLSPEERAKYANLKCKSAVRTAKQAEIVNAVSQAGGQAAIQSMGQQSVNTASQSGLISETHAQAAKLSKTTAKLQGVLGAANLYMSTKMAKHETNHRNNMNILKQAANSDYKFDEAAYNSEGKRIIRADNDVQNAIIRHNNLNATYDYMNGQDDEKRTQVSSRAQQANEVMQNEQLDAFSRSHQSKEATQIEAAKQLANMASSTFAAVQAAKTARLARKTEQKLGNPVLPNFGVDPADLKRQQEQQEAITDGASGDSGASSSDTIQDITTSTDLVNGAYNVGDGTGDPGEKNAPQGPPAGDFTASAGSGSAGGGGGGLGGGVGGNAPPAPNQDEAKPQYAGNFEGKDRYEGTGSMTRGVGGGNKGGAGAGDGGIDFNSLLAKFLPSEEDKQSPSVLETEFGGNRGIAAVNSAPSMLDAKADLFGRVHDLYQEKHSRGQVGTR